MKISRDRQAAISANVKGRISFTIAANSLNNIATLNKVARFPSKPSVEW
jgi:hypothetical protein